MSQPRRKRELVYYDQAGREYRSGSWIPTRGVSLSTVTPRIVDAYCPGRHLAAVLAPNGEHPPLVLVHNARLGPQPMLILSEAGLYAAMVSYHPEGTATVSSAGSPRPSFVVDCHSCGVSYSLSAARLAAARRKWKGDTPRRIALDPVS